ncbi:MAG: LPS-assembly protein LptD, partial [Rhodobacteraceae bacterium]|nr:LPS-assembly protein LptD [Paracoccaceae bacterium]
AEPHFSVGVDSVTLTRLASVDAPESVDVAADGVTLRAAGLPVFYLPRLRVPDPTQKRANGFLLPSIRSTTELGVGVRVPYFITMGDHRDLTLIPYLSPQTRTMGFRYRQAFTTGRIAFIGALTDDDLRPNTLRGYLFGEGTFDLANNWKLGFQLETSSDEAYLTNYGITDSDRLKSEIGVQRVDRDEAVRLTGTYYETLRSDPVNQLSPSAFVNGRYARRFKPAGLGGELSLTAKGNAYQTETNVDGLGRDVARATGDAVWYDHHVFGNGVRHDWRIGAAADLFQIRNDSRFDNIVPRITPRASYRLSLPMARRDKSGGRQVIEPVIQLGWAKVFGGAVPLDESRFVEFDQGDILSLSRFPAPDAREDAATLVYGVNWARTAVSGIEAWATLAQVLRSEADPRFSKSSGLSGVGSDFLMVGQLKVSDTFWIAGRTLLDDDFDFSKTEFRARLNYRSAKFDATYTYLEADQAEDRDIPIHEVYFDGDIALTDRWSAELGTRYSLEDYRPRQAGVVFTYTTECVQLDFSLRRRFTENENVAASTSFGVSVNLIGFSGPGQQTQAPRCAT